MNNQQLKAQIQELELQLRLNQSDIQSVAHEERLKIAHEIHDSLAQTIASLKLRFDILEKSIRADNTHITLKNLNKIRQGVNQANYEIRELIKNYRAPVNIQSLRHGLEQLVSEFRDNNRINLFLEHNCWPWPKEQKTKFYVYRIAQEALTNISKHSKANFVRIMLNCNQCMLHLLIEDDGQGFNLAHSIHETGKHVGIKIMRERAEDIQAEFSIETEPGEGCRINLKKTYKS